MYSAGSSLRTDRAPTPPKMTRSSSAVGLALEAMAMGSMSCLKGVGSRSAMSSSLQMKEPLRSTPSAIPGIGFRLLQSCSARRSSFGVDRCIYLAQAQAVSHP